MRSARAALLGVISIAFLLAIVMPAPAEGASAKPAAAPSNAPKAKTPAGKGNGPALAQGAKAKASANAPKEKAPDASAGETSASAGDAAAPGSPGQYRIGVVSRKKVLEKYTKVKAEYDKLQERVKGEQAEIDKLSDKIEGMKKDYEAQKDAMNPEDRATKEAEVQKEYSQYRYLLDTKQREINTEEELLMKKVLTEVDQVVSKIATEQGFHLVLEGSSRSGVLYYSPTIDITQRVVDALNSKQ